MNLLDFQAGIEHPFFLIAGPCVIESEVLALDSASYLKKVCEELNINFIYKSSFDKANRTSSDSFRGLGIEKGLRILEKVKSEVGVAVLTDVH
jgi:2-dehydro-3-deoxyphosphooctonate aldolase (KDO 8-P synthase)